jgi:SAM-dependent methyltransferase
VVENEVSRIRPPKAKACRQRKSKPKPKPKPLPKAPQAPADPTHNWTGAKAARYADRFVFSPEELDAHWRKHYAPEGRQHHMELALADQPRDRPVLEVGCNVGNQLVMLKGLGFTDVQGVDINPYAVKIAKSRGLEAQVADARKLPFPDNTFDLAMTCWCLCHIGPDDWDATLKELVRVSRRIFISEPERPRDSKEKNWSKPGYLWCRDIAGACFFHGLAIDHCGQCGLPGRVTTRMVVARRNADE